MIEFKYRPDVDGLRAVAVMLVLLYHAGLGFPGGYIGVDVFFVISGFLITGLILKEQDAGTFSLANFFLHNFYEPDGFLRDFQKDVMIPWRSFLSSMGLTWQRCYPIFFISGKNSSSTYHVDVSHVLAWQIHGVKVFNGFRDPENHAGVQHIVDNRNEYRVESPPNFDPDLILTYRMNPGDILWNQLLTPHWVDSEDEIAVSVNISHGGIAYHKTFCPNEQILRKRWEEHPDEAWLVDDRY